MLLIRISCSSCNRKHGLKALAHVGSSCRPRGNADSHCLAAFPDRSTAPTRAIGLNSLNDPLGYLVIPERYQNLIQNNLIEHLIASVRQASGKCEGMGTAVFD